MSIVYFLRDQNNRVKIGFTTNYHQSAYLNLSGNTANSFYSAHFPEDMLRNKVSTRNSITFVTVQEMVVSGFP